MNPVEPFVLLHDPRRYVACDWDLRVDHEARRYWVGFFISHLRTILELARQAELARGGDAAAIEQRARQCAATFDRRFVHFRDHPAHDQPVTILTLDCWRDEILRAHGFHDAFIDLKDRENARMLPLLPEVCRRLDAIDDPRLRLRRAVEGVFAGNIFDLGAKATIERFLGESPDFFKTIETLQPRPWLIDQYDQFERRFLEGVYRRCVYFVDNAGSDFLLGALPLTRLMTRSGVSVVLAGNERPTLNDMTVHDIRAWWSRIIDIQPDLRDGPIEIVSTGTGEPLIDLLGVSRQLNDAAREADLVILEGMGRGVESNLDAMFTVDALNLAMLKDQAVAKRHGGKLYDVVCRFRRGVRPGDLQTAAR